MNVERIKKIFLQLSCNVRDIDTPDFFLSLRTGKKQAFENIIENVICIFFGKRF